ncbi:serine hydrolase domain-containing protein [Micromonospora zhanjiangensis]|uniref:Serine hydrolase domain-containing protein n=1 Tax=Micromonospora zhanjiangensis TaxID=1522057 RepID=A0ABV8KHI6_9ACTN
MAHDWTTLQDRVRERVEELVVSGRELGVQVAAYLHGEKIVDVCAGVADPATGRPVTPDTPFFSYSTGKGLTGTVVHVLAERGELDYDLRIADVWPEFAAHGKGGITLRHALTHTAGVPALPADITPADLADWDRMCAVVAAAEPLWEPGARQGYHAWTYGWLVGETVRRATGRTVSRVLADDVAAPLGVAGELYFGVPNDRLDRVAPLVDDGYAAAMAGFAAQVENLGRVLPPGALTTAELANRREILRADLPATGTLTARAAAKMYAALLGEVDGVRLISPARLAEVSAVAVTGPDWVFGMETSRTLGYAVEAGGFGCSGSGGSLAGAFPDRGLTVAATKNLLRVGGDGDDPMEDLRALIRDAVA